MTATFSRAVTAAHGGDHGEGPEQHHGPRHQRRTTRRPGRSPSRRRRRSPAGRRSPRTAAGQDPAAGSRADRRRLVVVHHGGAVRALQGCVPARCSATSCSPRSLEENDSAAVTLGLRFTVDTPGSISAIRFYKAAGNTGAHTGTLWNANGTQLATGTFTGESTTGWQTLTLSQPVSVTTGHDVRRVVPHDRRPVLHVDGLQRRSTSPGVPAAGDARPRAPTPTEPASRRTRARPTTWSTWCSAGRHRPSRSPPRTRRRTRWRCRGATRSGSGSPPPSSRARR